MNRCVDMGDFESSVENLVLAKAENLIHNWRKANFKDLEQFLRDDLVRFCDKYNKEVEYGYLLVNSLIQPALRYVATSK